MATAQLVGTPLNVTGLTGPVHGPYELVSAAQAAADGFYQVNLFMVVTTPDVLDPLTSIGFLVGWTDVGGPTTKHMTMTGNEGVDITLDFIGASQWITGLVYNLAGNPITLSTFLSDGPGTSTSIYSLRGRVVFITPPPPTPPPLVFIGGFVEIEC